MNINSILAGLRTAGLQVAVIDGRLRVSPKDRVTGGIRQAIREHQDELLAALSDPANDGMSAPLPVVTIPPLASRGPMAVPANTRGATPWANHGDIPQEWIAGVSLLIAMTKPDDIPYPRWRLVQSTALAFLPQWAATAHRLGWTIHEIFGCNRVEPCRRWDGQGLVFSLADGEAALVSIDRDHATIRTKGGARQTFYRPLTAKPVCQRLLWDES